MALLEINEGDRVPVDAALQVALCGSFRRDPKGLAQAFEALRANFDVLSPSSLDFVDPTADFVRLPREIGQPAHEIEARHLEAIRSADFVWLHAPDGYIGSSAAMELGHAAALGVPVFTSVLPEDRVLSSFVRVVPTPSEITADLLEDLTDPGLGISRLQQYYETTARRRGWGEESAEATLARLTDEVDELTKAVRKLDAGVRPEDDPDADVAGELADVQLYLVHLANSLGFDLAVAVTDKELVNARRFPRVRNVA